MENIKNINDAKKLGVGEKFTFGEYQGEPIDWLKLNEDTAISVYILDRIIFNDSKIIENNYDNSIAHEWCEALSISLGLVKNSIYILSDKEIFEFWPKVNERIAIPTEFAAIRSFSGAFAYWTSSTTWFNNDVCVVNEQGKFAGDPMYKLNGIRPALRF